MLAEDDRKVERRKKRRKKEKDKKVEEKEGKEMRRKKKERNSSNSSWNMHNLTLSRVYANRTDPKTTRVKSMRIALQECLSSKWKFCGRYVY